MSTRFWSLAGAAILEVDTLQLTVIYKGERRVWREYFGNRISASKRGIRLATDLALRPTPATSPLAQPRPPGLKQSLCGTPKHRTPPPLPDRRQRHGSIES